MFGLKEVEYSRTDLQQGRKTPKEINEQLAELIGAHVGDGCINRNKQNIEITYSGCTEDIEYHRKFLKNSYKNLFNYETKIKFPNEKEVSTKIYSKTVWTFLTRVIGLVIGSKKKMDGIPKIIMKSNKKIKIAFIRGLADTDFSLVCNGSKSKISVNLNNKKIIRDSQKILQDIGFKPYVQYDIKRFDKRYDKFWTNHYLQLSGMKNLNKWMDDIGFNNIKHRSKYLIFKKNGESSVRTTLNERLKKLKNGPVGI